MKCVWSACIYPQVMRLFKNFTERAGKYTEIIMSIKYFFRTVCNFRKIVYTVKWLYMKEFLNQIWIENLSLPKIDLNCLCKRFFFVKNVFLPWNQVFVLYKEMYNFFCVVVCKIYIVTCIDIHILIFKSLISLESWRTRQFGNLILI